MPAPTELVHPTHFAPPSSVREKSNTGIRHPIPPTSRQNVAPRASSARLSSVSASLYQFSDECSEELPRVERAIGDSRPVGNLGLNIQCRAVPAFNQGGPSESSADKIQRQVQTQGSGSPKKKDRKAGEKRRRRHAETYNTYIFRVLKQVHPNTGISKKSMMIMNSF
ncbi:hypothetical protein FOZ62_013002, partial [Perkinsus olseni]